MMRILTHHFFMCSTGINLSNKNSKNKTEITAPQKPVLVILAKTIPVIIIITSKIIDKKEFALNFSPQNLH